MPDFRSNTKNRSLTRLGMEQATAQQLSQDAFSLAPDSDAITKALLDKKLFNADLAPIQSEVSGIMGEYLEKFDKDPYYAFSREGRKTAGVLKNIVNHSSIRDWEQNTAAAEAEYKKASDNRLNKNLVVRGNDVLAIKDGRRQYISINDIKSLNTEKGERLLDVDSDMQGIKSTYGVRGGVPSYDMNKLDDVDEKIQKAFTNLGSTDVGGTRLDVMPGIDAKVREKSDEKQMGMALRTLMTSGLTEADKNTLRSEYVKSTGGGSSSQGFQAWLGEKLAGIATGKISTIRENTLDESISSKSAGKPGGKVPPTTDLSAASRILNNVTGNRKVVDVVGNAGQSLQGNLLPVQETLNNSSSPGFKDDFGNNYSNRTVKDLKVFSDATDLKNLSVRNEKTGTWEKLPGISQVGVVNDRPGSEPALVWQYSYADQNGEVTPIPVKVAMELNDRINKGAPIPDNLQKYVTTLPLEQAIQNVMRSSEPDEQKQQRIVNLQAQSSSDGLVRYLENKPWIDFSVIIPKGKGVFKGNISQDAQEVGKTLDDFGVQSQESAKMKDYHMKYSGQGDITNYGSNPFVADDEFYEVKSRVPLTSFEQLNSAYGGKTLGYKEDIHIDTSRLRDNYELISPSLFNSGTIPNQAGGKKRATINDIN